MIDGIPTQSRFGGDAFDGVPSIGRGNEDSFDGVTSIARVGADGEGAPILVSAVDAVPGSAITLQARDGSDCFPVSPGRAPDVAQP